MHGFDGLGAAFRLPGVVDQTAALSLESALAGGLGLTDGGRGA